MIEKEDKEKRENGEIERKRVGEVSLGNYLSC